MPSPNPGGSSRYNILFSVAATSSGNAWAVGTFTPGNRCCREQALILHWNGTSWTHVPSPIPAPAPVGDALNGVSADSASDAWAVGWAGCHTLTLHWDGTSWSRVKSPGGLGCYAPGVGKVLDGVSADSGSDAWATGYNCTNAAQCAPLLLHWDGRSWAKGASPHPSSLTEPDGVSALSGSDAWAVGAYYDVTTHADKTLILHWNGTSWTKE